MSKQKQGMFRRMLDAGRKAMGLTVTHYYKDPVLRAPLDRVRKKSWSPAKVRVKRVLPCKPGDILFYDKLVCHFGRRQVDRYGRMIQHRDEFGQHDQLHLLPTEQEFADNPPWAFLK